MAYRVELANSAETQLEELYLWVIERAPSRGAAWFNGLERIAPESFDPDQPVRVLTTVAVLTFIECSSPSMTAPESSVSSTSGVERGEGRHLVSSNVISGPHAGTRHTAAESRPPDPAGKADRTFHRSLRTQ